MNKPHTDLQQLQQAILMQRLQKRIKQSVTREQTRIELADRQQPLLLSYAQQRMWFMTELDRAASIAYHIPAQLRLKGSLNQAALKDTLDCIVARHESLRTTFVNADGAPVQRIAAAGAGMALEQRDLRHLPQRECEIAVQSISDEEAIRPFDLAAGPLIRGQLLRLAEEEHVLLLTQHHIVSDGWSIGVLVREISTLYAAFSAGQADPLPPLAIQYADYAAWQRGWLQGDILQAQTAFWKEQLTGAPALLELPTDRPRPDQQSYAGDTVPVSFDAALTAGLKALSQKHGATLFMTLLAGWAALLARLSGQDDVVVGTPVANRQRAEVEGLIGFFVNTLALRVKLEGDPSVAQLLAQVKAHMLGAYEHQDLPFEQVVEAVQPARSMRHSPLFQVMLSLDNAPGGTLQLPGLSIDGVQPKQNTAQFDLTLSLAESDGRLSGTLRYASDLFDEASIVRLAGHLETLLRGMAADDSARVATLPLLSAAQRHELLCGFNEKARGYAQDVLPQQQLIHQQFEARALAEPDAIALVHDNVSLTYAELNRRANRLARHLSNIGVRPDARVALCLERGIGMVIGILATLKAGGGYVPLDPDYPADRLNYMIEDSAPVVLLTESALAALVDGLSLGEARVVLIDGADAAAIAGQADSNLNIAGLAPAHLAYIIYTSGSTGLPKGVMIEHRNVTRLFAATEQWYGFHSSDTWTLFHSFAFDFSVWELWGALLYGGRLVIVPYLVSRSPQDFYQLLCEQGVTVLNQTPSAFRQLVAAQAASDAVHQLRTVVFGGEALDLASLRPWYRDARNGATQLVNMYGITETTVHVTYRPVNAADAELAGASPIGVPIPDLQIYILDQHGEPAPIGVTGELHVGGAGVARGYLNRPELNAQRFVADRFSGTEGARLYKTGDLGRWLADGSIEYLGRNDFQVKIRGFRIELGEIEARLLACDGVNDAVVVARAGESGQTGQSSDQRLVAYVTPQRGTTLVVAELRAQLARHLADFMIPGALVVLDALPLSPNGKLDRKALPAPDRSAVETAAYQPPQGGTETAIAAIWQQLLGIEQVGRDDHFFALGGHSLLAVQVVSRLRQAFEVEIALRELFDDPSLIALAQLVDAAGRSTMTAIVRADRRQPLPLSWAQQRLWFLDQLDATASAAYHIPFGLKLSGVLDKPALRAALDRIVARHEALRTTFVKAEGQAVQVIAPADTGFTLEERDLSSLPSNERLFTADSMGVAEAHQPFDLAQGPLARGCLLRLSEQEHILLITLHHIIADGWSLGVLMEELAALYSACSQGLPDPLPALAIQYADYAAWQREWLQGEALQSQIGYWKQHLDGAPALLTLPTDRNRPAVQGYAGGAVPFVVPADVAAGLRALAQRHGTTLFMTMLGAWAILLSRLSGQSDVVIGVPVANRQRAEAESLIGFFVNTLALRVRLEDDPTVAALLTQVKADTLAAYAHQDLPFDQVVEALKPPRSMSHSPIFQAMLNMTTAQASRAAQLPGLRLEQTAVDSSSVHFDLSLTLADVGEAIHGGIAYASDLFDESTVQRFAAMFHTLLRELSGGAHADAGRVSGLGLLDAAARQQVLVDFNQTRTACADDRLLHTIFEEQVALRPAAPAVLCEDQSLSFAELNCRANRLAHALIARGVRPDSLVALCVERSVEMLVGILGILKAGGAYVPLDPSHPQERLAYVLEDCAPTALVTSCALLGTLPALALSTVPVLLLDDTVEAALEGAGESNPDPQALGLTARHLAYVIYTSGSTGNAKGVMVEHASPVNFWHVLERTTHRYCTPNGNVALNAAYSFDMSLKGILQLLSGRCVVLIPQLIRADGPALLRFLAQHRIEAFDCTPSQLSVLLSAGLIGNSAYQPVSVLIGGEPIDAVMWHTLKAAPGIRFYNMYGPTECTVDATICQIREAGDTPNIGWPIDNMQIYLLDQHGQPVPPGVAGEIHIGGIGVARGYLRRPQLTSERFLADAFSTADHARVYKTGDLGRWLPDGRIEYLGRNDFQVKIRGFRIELGEIEAKLAGCDGVRDALVVATDDAHLGKRLVAYVTARQGAQLSGGALRSALGAQLADYMVPAAFMVLAAFPLNANGKVDRKALPLPDASAFVSRAYAPPQGRVEQVVAQLWQELLGVRQVGRLDHFFELGGHSLLAVQFASRLRDTLGIELPLRELFAHPTVQALAEAIGALGEFQQNGNLVPIRAGGKLRPLFLVHPGEGEIGYARSLAPWLDGELPLYGLAASGFLAGEVPACSVEEMAASYVRQIRAVQPQGPYRLAGWSAGGTIAYEMANQLIGADQTVEFLGLIDTRCDYSEPSEPEPALVTVEGGAARRSAVPAGFDAWMRSMEWVPAHASDGVRADLLALGGNVEAMLARCQGAGLLPQQIGADMLRRYLAVQHGIAVALRQYARPPIPAGMTLFTATDEQRADTSLGWHAAAGRRLTVRPVGGNHRSIMEMPWIERLGAVLSAELDRATDAAPRYEELAYAPRIAIQSGRPQVAPLFCIPGAGASITAFTSLAQAVDATLPIYGLQPRGLCGTLVPHVDVPSAARSYVAAIREAVPYGPYRLLGHSFGGWVALEVARQLVAAGETVSALVILDTDAPSPPGAPQHRHSRIDMLLRLVEIFELNLNQTLGLTADDFAGSSHEEQLAVLLARLVAVRLMPPGTSVHTLQGIVRVFETNLNTDYQPDGRYLGPVHLVAVPQEEADGGRQYAPDDLLTRWRRFAPDIRFLDGPGNHMTLLQRPHIDAVAAWILPLLKDVK